MLAKNCLQFLTNSNNKNAKAFLLFSNKMKDVEDSIKK